MYKAFDSHLENESKDDEGSLSSSFWTDRESEGEDRDYVKKENRRIERKLERDNNDEKEIFVMGDDTKDMMKETLQGNELEKKKYVQAETNPKADEEGSEVNRECFMEVEMEKGIEVTRTDQEKEEEEEKGQENEEEKESEDEERELDEEEDSEDEEKELEEEEEESEDEEEESEAEEKEFEEEEQKGKESEEEETGHESEEEEMIKELEEESQVEGEEEQESEEVKKELTEEEEEEKRKEREEKEESEEEKGEASEEEEEGSRDEEEEFELCEQGKRNKKEEEDLETSEEEEDSEEEKESSVNGENSEENKTQSNDSESEKDQVSVEESEEEEECFPKEDSNSEETCTGKDSDSDEKKEGLTKEESTGGSGEEEQDEEEGEENEEGDNVCCVSEENKGIEHKIDGGKSFVKKESTENSEREGSENSKQNESEPKNEEDMNDNEEKYFFAKDSTEENPDSNEEQERNDIGDGNSEEEERECFINEYDKEIELGKSDEKDEDISSDVNLAENRSGADEHESGMEEDEEVSKGGREEKEEIDWFFDAPVGEKEIWDQDRKSWASDDDYVTISSGHSQKEEEDDHNMLPAWEEERADVRQKKETRDIYDEDFHESLGSPAASILTSGYGTYRPDSSKDGDPEEVDYRDDCTLAGLEEESESILDAHDEDNSSLAWFGDDQALGTSDGGAPGKSPDDRKDVAVHCTDQSHDGSEDDGHQFPDTPSKGHEANPLQTPTGNDIGTQDAGSQNVAYFNDGLEVEALRDSLDHPFNLRHRRGRVQRRPEGKQNDDGYDDGSNGKRVRAHTGCLGVLHCLQGFAYFVYYIILFSV